METTQTTLANTAILRVIDPDISQCDRPLLDGGKLVASDGRILIVFDDPSQYSGEACQVVDGKYDRDGAKARAYPWQKAVQPISAVITWQIPPNVEGPPPEVDERWVLTFPCSTCGGDGICECCDCDTSHSCGHCDGTGTCRETVDEANERVAFGYVDIARRYAWLISTLPNVTWAAQLDNDESPILFRFDGGQGVVMPMRKE